MPEYTVSHTLSIHTPIHSVEGPPGTGRVYMTRHPLEAQRVTEELNAAYTAGFQQATLETKRAIEKSIQTHRRTRDLDGSHIDWVLDRVIAEIQGAEVIPPC